MVSMLRYKVTVWRMGHLRGRFSPPASSHNVYRPRLYIKTIWISCRGQQEVSPQPSCHEIAPLCGPLRTNAAIWVKYIEIKQVFVPKQHTLITWRIIVDVLQCHPWIWGHKWTPFGFIVMSAWQQPFSWSLLYMCNLYVVFTKMSVTGLMLETPNVWAHWAACILLLLTWQVIIDSITGCM